MSNSVAIAAVTATLRNLLQSALNTDPSAISHATVGTFNPADRRGTPPFVNVFLYHVTPNAALRNLDAPTRTSAGNAVQRPQAALNLHYLISCSGDDAMFIPQRMLGTVVSTLHAQPVLSRDLIAQSIATVAAGDPAHLSFLTTSDLAKAVELVKLTPENLSTEEMTKIWSVFFQAPYLLSVSYVASAVLLEAAVTPARALPVRARGAYVVAGLRPVITSVILQSDALLPPYAAPAPITAGSPVFLRGSNLSGDNVHVVVGGVDITIPVSDNTGDRIALTLPALPAGVFGVQVAQRLDMGSPLALHQGVVSNAYPIVVHPQITAIAAANIVTTTIDGVDFNAADITLTLDPPVGVEQRVSLLLNQFSAAPAPPAHAYTFEAKARDKVHDPLTSSTITLPVSGVVSGTYMVRALVDGAESVPVGGMGNPYPQRSLP